MKLQWCQVAGSLVSMLSLPILPVLRLPSPLQVVLGPGLLWGSWSSWNPLAMEHGLFLLLPVTALLALAVAANTLVPRCRWGPGCV